MKVLGVNFFWNTVSHLGKLGKPEWLDGRSDRQNCPTKNFQRIYSAHHLLQTPHHRLTNRFCLLRLQTGVLFLCIVPVYYRKDGEPLEKVYTSFILDPLPKNLLKASIDVIAVDVAILSDCLSGFGTASKWLNISSYVLQYMVAQSF